MSDKPKVLTHAGPRSLSFIIEGEPKTQGSVAPGIRKNGTLYTRHDNRADVLAWRTQAQWEIKAAMRAERVQMFPRSVPVSVVVDFYFTKPKKPSYTFPPKDADKSARLLGDALEGTIVENDAQIVEWRVRKHYADTGRARTEVHVWVESEVVWCEDVGT